MTDRSDEPTLPGRRPPTLEQRAFRQRVERRKRLRRHWTEPGTGDEGQDGDEKALLESLPLSARYAPRVLLGSGGQGIVVRVYDRELDRDAALKTVRAEGVARVDRDRFLEEARATARLGHPNIVPIFDVGELEDGRPFYTMQLISGRSLGDVLHALAADEAGRGDGAASREWTLVHLVQVLQQVCHALQLAHEQGVVHRDIKPSNVMLGPFEEVLLVDWGIAKRADRTGHGGAEGRDRAVRADDTAVGHVKGTVAYMSPEQALAHPLDARSDIYSVGVLLYEILTLHRPFEGRDVDDLLQAVIGREPLRPEVIAVRRTVPPELSQLARRCLSKRRDDRPGSAREVAGVLQDFVEGAADRRRREEAAAVIEIDARQAMRRHELATREAQHLENEIARLEREYEPWLPIEDKLPLLRARERLEKVRALAWTAFIHGVDRHTDALAHVPDHPGIRRELADIFWDRFVRAEGERDDLQALVYRALVERFDDGGEPRDFEGRGGFVVEADPDDARLTLHRLEESDLVHVDGPGRLLGTGRAFETGVPVGPHVLVAVAPGRETVRHPFLVERGRTSRLRLRLPAEGELPPGFVPVQGGACRLGGDAWAPHSWTTRRLDLPPFAMGRYPVTFGEYRAFLADLPESAVGGHVPVTAAGKPACVRDAAGAWTVAVPLSQRFLERFGAGARDRLPVFGVPRWAAESYARWLSARDGAAYRLPTAEEWEHVARAPDQREHPWGRRHDPALYHGAESLGVERDLAPVGAFATDVSAHGVRDLAGAVREWTSSWFDELRGVAETRGCGWCGPSQAARSATRHPELVEAREEGLGFRLAFTW